MNAEQKSAANICKPVPTGQDYSGHQAAAKDASTPKDGFATKETIEKTVAVVPAVKAKDLSGSLKATHCAAGATSWELGGDNHANPSIRSFAGSKSRSGQNGRKRASIAPDSK